MDYTPPEPIYAEITAYNARSASSQTGHITADGTDTDHRRYGLAAERSIPFGSIVYIPAGYGYLDRARAFDRSFVVDDRGGGLETESAKINRSTSNHIYRLDLRVEHESYAKLLGRKRLIVYISYPIEGDDK